MSLKDENNLTMIIVGVSEVRLSCAWDGPLVLLI